MVQFARLIDVAFVAQSMTKNKEPKLSHIAPLHSPQRWPLTCRAHAGQLMLQGHTTRGIRVAFAAAFSILAQAAIADEPAKHVSPDNFNRAESYMNFKTKVDAGMF